jgi:hypothetical protein
MLEREDEIALSVNPSINFFCLLDPQLGFADKEV